MSVTHVREPRGCEEAKPVREALPGGIRGSNGHEPVRKRGDLGRPLTRGLKLSCRKTVLLLLLRGMCGEISDLAALTAHRKLDPDRNGMENNRSSHSSHSYV